MESEVGSNRRPFRRGANFVLGAWCDQGVGFETLRKISEANRSFKSVIDLDDIEELRRLLGRSELIEQSTGAKAWKETRTRALENAIRRTEELILSNVSIILHGDEDYPKQLNSLKNPPHWLFVQGDKTILKQPSISVVGSREASAEGLWLTRYVGHWLREFGAPTVSGLAEGIDQVIHMASIEANVPTVAFLGTGIFTEFPKGSDRLRQAILSHGGVIATEYLIKEGYSASNFVRRNRLQAALGRILIPTEWAAKSGTAHTVRYAYEIARPIAFLRTPIQASFDWIPREYVSNNGFFTIPRDQGVFLDFIFNSLNSDPKPPTLQLKLL